MLVCPEMPMKFPEIKKGKNSDRLWFAAGLIAVILGLIPYAILKRGSIVTIPDQLDGEIVAYFLAAKHFLSGSGFYPEYMGGVSSTALVPPSPGSVIFYLLFDIYAAFLVNLSFVVIIAFTGMFFLCRKLTDDSFYAMCAAVIFAYLPFQTVYGLCVAGVPLVALAFLELKEHGFKKWPYLLLPVIYALFSSLVLSGYAVSAVYILAMLIIAIRNKKKEEPVKLLPLLTGSAVMILTYVIVDFRLISEILLGTGEVSHKTEYVYHGYGFAGSFWELLTKGNIGAPSLHTFIFAAAVITIAFFLIMKKKTEDQSRLLGVTVILFSAAVLIAAFYSFIQSGFVAGLRNASGSSLASFQIDRFYWLYPCIWYVLLCVICGMWTKKYKLFGRIISLALLCVCAWTVLQNGPFKTNLREVLKPEDSNSLAFENYISEDEYRFIADAIYEEYGLKQDEYRVASLGLEPAVSVVNGFSTIDGYSNNYPLEYKHRFRRIMADELDENDYNRQYFDEWGNRCYIYASEYYGNVFLSKYQHAYYRDLKLDTGAMKELGCDFLLAAGMIENAEDLGLELVTVADIPYCEYFIYVYKIS